MAHCRVPIVAGLWPFDSALNAEFMANEVPDVVVPEALVERMRATSGARGRRSTRARGLPRELLAERCGR